MYGSGPPKARFSQSGVVGLIPIPTPMAMRHLGQVGFIGAMLSFILLNIIADRDARNIHPLYGFQGAHSMQSYHYVYYYLRNKDTATAKAGTPYYVGEGKLGRAYSKDHLVSVPTDPSCIIKIANGLTKKQAQKMEILHIAMWVRKDLGTGILHNRTNGGDGVTGHSPETRKKMSDAKKGRRFTMSEKHKAAISRSRMGHVVTEETREKIRIKRALQTIALHSEDAKRKIGKKNSGTGNGMFGKKLSDETKQRISTAIKGRVVSEETRAKISKATKGKPRRPWSEELREKMKNRPIRKLTDEERARRRGRVVSEETKRKISEAKRLRRLEKQQLRDDL